MKSGDLQSELIASRIGSEDMLKEAFRKLRGKEEKDEQFEDEYELAKHQKWQNAQQRLGGMKRVSDVESYRLAPKETAARDAVAIIGDTLVNILAGREKKANRKLMKERRAKRAEERGKELEELKGLAHEEGLKRSATEKQKEEYIANKMRLAEEDRMARMEDREYRRNQDAHRLALEEEDRKWKQEQRTTSQQDRELRKQEHALRLQEIGSRLAEKEAKQTRQQQISQVEAFKNSMSPDEYVKMLAKAQKGEFDPAELEKKQSGGGLLALFKGKSKPTYAVKERKQVPMKKPDGTIVWVEDD